MSDFITTINVPLYIFSLVIVNCLAAIFNVVILMSFMCNSRGIFPQVDVSQREIFLQGALP